MRIFEKMAKKANLEVATDFAEEAAKGDGLGHRSQVDVDNGRQGLKNGPLLKKHKFPFLLIE